VRGVIDRFRSMPMARSAVLIGRTVADLVRNVLVIVLMTGVGYLIGFRFQAGLLNALACIAVVCACGCRAQLRALDGGVPASLGGAAAWIIGLLAIFVPLCVWRYRRMD
jgi:hypothetical protein